MEGDTQTIDTQSNSSIHENIKMRLSGETSLLEGEERKYSVMLTSFSKHPQDLMN